MTGWIVTCFGYQGQLWPVGRQSIIVEPAQDGLFGDFKGCSIKPIDCPSKDRRSGLPYCAGMDPQPNPLNPAIEAKREPHRNRAAAG